MAVSTAAALVLHDFSSGYTAEIFRAGTVIPIGGLIQEEYDGLIVAGSILELQDFELDSAVLNHVDWYGCNGDNPVPLNKSSYYRRCWESNFEDVIGPRLTLIKGSGQYNPVVTLSIRDFTWSEEDLGFLYSGSDPFMEGSYIYVYLDSSMEADSVRSYDFANGDQVTFYFQFSSDTIFPLGTYNLEVTVSSSVPGVLGFPLTKTFVIHTGEIVSSEPRAILPADLQHAPCQTIRTFFSHFPDNSAVRILGPVIQKPVEFTGDLAIRFCLKGNSGNGYTPTYYSDNISVGNGEYVSDNGLTYIQLTEFPYVSSINEVYQELGMQFSANTSSTEGMLIYAVKVIVFREDGLETSIPDEEAPLG